MRVTAQTLQRFYETPLGRHAASVIGRRLSALWPDAAGLDLIGLGFATPYLARYVASARRVVAFMPAAQGALAWPTGEKGLAAQGEETRLPFMDAAFDRAIIVHYLEEAESTRTMLRELWRIVAPEGRIAVIVANRTGLWALSDATPFGHGRPYSRRQLSQLLRDAMFEPTANARVLHAPPWGFDLAAPIARELEKIGDAVAPPLGGVVMMEAVKRLAAGNARPAPAQAVRETIVEAGLRRSKGSVSLCSCKPGQPP
jgi:SAM-dependent methyltransferase